MNSLFLVPDGHRGNLGAVRGPRGESRRTGPFLRAGYNPAVLAINTRRAEKQVHVECQFSGTFVQAAMEFAT